MIHPKTQGTPGTMFRLWKAEETSRSRTDLPDAITPIHLDVYDGTFNKRKTSQSDWTINAVTFLHLGFAAAPSQNASVCHMKPEPLSHDCIVDPTLPSSTLHPRQSSVPLRLFPWQLPWQQPLLDQAPIHGMTLEWPLHGSLKHTDVEKETQNGVIILIIMMTKIGHFKISDDT